MVPGLLCRQRCKCSGRARRWHAQTSPVDTSPPPSHLHHRHRSRVASKHSFLMPTSGVSSHDTSVVSKLALHPSHNEKLSPCVGFDQGLSKQVHLPDKCTNQQPTLASGWSQDAGDVSQRTGLGVYGALHELIVVVAEPQQVPVSFGCVCVWSKREPTEHVQVPTAPYQVRKQAPQMDVMADGRL